MFSFLRPKISKAKASFNLGVAALARADLAGAKAALLKCVELDPTSADGWCYLGMALVAREPVSAAEALDRALALDENHTGALYWRAEVFWLQGDPRSAAGMLRRLTAIAPNSAQNLSRLAFACLDAGDMDAAMAAFLKATEVGGGLAAATQSHVELRRATYLHHLNRPDAAMRLIRDINGGGPRDYSPARYPRNMHDQLSALENVVNGRHILILGSGPSLGQLQPLLEQIGTQRCQQLCFFGFNNVPVAERILLDTLRRGVDLACMTAAAVMDLHAAWIEAFLGRASAPGLFLTLADAASSGPFAATIKRYPEKLFYFAASGDYPPIPEDPLHFPPINTLMCVLPLAVLGRPRNVFLFGCDGAAPSALTGSGEVYFRQGSREYGKQDVRTAEYARWLARDTFFFNAYIPTVLASLSVLHRVTLPPIYLCNPESAYRPFPRITGQEFVRMVT
jgi:tetratricopeptide (TPR) repeat protein